MNVSTLLPFVYRKRSLGRLTYITSNIILHVQLFWTRGRSCCWRHSHPGEAILWQAEETAHPKRSKTAVANVAVVTDPPLSILTDKIDCLLKQQEELLGYMSQSAKQSASGYLSTRASVPPSHTSSYISPHVYTDGGPSLKVRC